jgi:hypothetical protein
VGRKEPIPICKRGQSQSSNAGLGHANCKAPQQLGHSGYVALFEIVDNANVVVAAVRHQLEDDYH